MKKRRAAIAALAVAFVVVVALLLARRWFFRVADPESEWVTIHKLYWNTSNGRGVIKAKTLEKGWIDVTWEVEKQLRWLPRQYRLSKRWSPSGGGSERYSVILEDRPYEGPPIPRQEQQEDFTLPWWVAEITGSPPEKRR
jgi:hypothetical protein